MRIFPDRYGKLRLPEGGYGKDLRGQWFVRPPGEDTTKVENSLVTEHRDGAISVFAGINGHGVLIEHGIWRNDNEGSKA